MEGLKASLRVPFHNYVRFYSIQNKINFKSKNQVIKEDNRSKPRSSHVFKQLYPWKTRSQLVDHLVSNVVYNEGLDTF